MSRQEFSRKTKAQGFLRCAGACEECGARLVPGKFAYHHIKEANDGGAPTLENLRVLCDPCHAPLTARYVQETRRAERQRDRYIGAFPKSARPLPCGKTSPFKKKFSGEVVRR